MAIPPLRAFPRQPLDQLFFPFSFCSFIHLYETICRFFYIHMWNFPFYPKRFYFKRERCQCMIFRICKYFNGVVSLNVFVSLLENWAGKDGNGVYVWLSAGWTGVSSVKLLLIGVPGLGEGVWPGAVLLFIAAEVALFAFVSELFVAAETWNKKKKMDFANVFN